MPSDESAHAQIDLVAIDLRELAADTAREVARFYLQPVNLSGLAGSMLLPLVVFRRKPPLLPYLIVAAAGWAAGRMAYQASKDLHDLAAQARDQPD